MKALRRKCQLKWMKDLHWRSARFPSMPGVVTGCLGVPVDDQEVVPGSERLMGGW